MFSWHLASRVVVKEMEVLCGKEKLYCFCSFSFTMQEVYINAQVSLQTLNSEPFSFSFTIRDLPINLQCLYFLLRLSYDAEILLDISGKVQDCGKNLQVLSSISSPSVSLRGLKQQYGTSSSFGTGMFSVM